MKRLYANAIKKKEELLDRFYDFYFEVEENWTDKTEKTILFATCVATETLFVLGIMFSKIGLFVLLGSILNMLFFFKKRKSYTLLKSMKGRRLYREKAEQDSITSREYDIQRGDILANSDEKVQPFGYPLPKKALYNQRYVLYGNESPHMQFTKNGNAELNIWEYNKFSKLIFVTWNPIILAFILFMKSQFIIRMDFGSLLIIIVFGALQQAFLYYLLQQFEDREKDKTLIFNEALFEQNAYQVRLEKSRREAVQQFTQMAPATRGGSALDSVDLQINSPPASGRPSFANNSSPLNDSLDSNDSSDRYSISSVRTSYSTKQESNNNLLSRKLSSTSVHSSGLNAPSVTVPPSARSSIAYSTAAPSTSKSNQTNVNERSSTVSNPFQSARNNKK